MPEDSKTEEERKRKERDLILALFLLLSQDTQHTLTSRIQDYLHGSLTYFALTDALTAALMDAHAHAAYLGRRLAGNRQTFGVYDAQFSQVVMLGQSPYLQRLVTDVVTGKYTPDADGTLPGDLTSRIGMYVKRLRGTANHAWALSLPADTLIYWRLGSTEQHCTGCPPLAEGSPYTNATLPTVPCNGDTPCLTSCDCFLETETGERGFELE
jgi:hypothetical protein